MTRREREISNVASHMDLEPQPEYKVHHPTAFYSTHNLPYTVMTNKCKLLNMFLLFFSIIRN